MTWPAKFPKPPRRPPKGRTRIARGLAQLNNPRRSKMAEADRLWRILIYAKATKHDGSCLRCIMLGLTGRASRIRRFSDAMHGFSRGSHPGMKWDVDNGLPGCRPCHRRIDSDHAAKVELFTFYLGREGYAALELRAQARGKVDLDLVLMDLLAQVVKLAVTPVTRKSATRREPRLDLTHLYWRNG